MDSFTVGLAKLKEEAKVLNSKAIKAQKEYKEKHDEILGYKRVFAEENAPYKKGERVLVKGRVNISKSFLSPIFKEVDIEVEIFKPILFIKDGIIKYEYKSLTINKDGKASKKFHISKYYLISQEEDNIRRVNK